MNKKIFDLIKISAIAVFLIAGFSNAQNWTEPPPAGPDAIEPVNVGSITDHFLDQDKPGKLSVDYLNVWNGANFAAYTGSVDIGTTGLKAIGFGKPSATLNIYGNEYIGAGGALTITSMKKAGDPVKQVCASQSSASLNGGTLMKCPAINGVCGQAAGAVNATDNTAPSDNLCLVGRPTKIIGTNPWNWTCVGFYGGTTANCSATKVVHGSRVYSTPGTYLATPIGNGPGMANSTAFKVPPGVTEITLVVYGAGGGGGGGGGANLNDAAGGGGGGGAGGLSIGGGLTVTQGDVLTITVGAGGVGGFAGTASINAVYSGTLGSDGGASSVINKSTGAVLVSSDGGGGGGGGGAASGSGEVSGGGGAGGSSMNGTWPGGSGGDGQTYNEFGGHGGSPGNGAGIVFGGSDSDGSNGPSASSSFDAYNIYSAGKGGGGGSGGEGQNLVRHSGGAGGNGAPGAIGIFW